MFLVQHVNEITRLRDGQKNILDLILTDDECKISDVIIMPPVGKSDHALISFMCNVGFAEVNHRRKNLGYMTKEIMRNCISFWI